MKKTMAWLSLTAGCSLLAVCGDRRIGDSSVGTNGASGASADTTSTTDLGATNTGPPNGSEGSSDDDPTAPPLECFNGKVACPGETECVSLYGNVAHCGECNHGCEGFGTSVRCTQGQCQPAIWPCIPRDQGIETCSQACASVGETCAVDVDLCSGFAEVWLTDSANDNDPQQNLDACINGFSGQAVFELSCDDPIDWEFEISGRTVVGVACCCTQP